MIHNLTTFVSLASLLILLYGVLTLITWPAPQECRMTYMFQYPQYTRIAVRQDADHPAYKLFAYSEGGSEAAAPPPSRSRHRFTGAPVLFVHGNAGTYKQMRSLASVALRKAIDLRGSRNARHLDYFAVDYNGEFSALFGGYLQPQADYLRHCVHAIAELYDGAEGAGAAAGGGIIIVAHSMGGKVAQAALQHANVSSLVHTVLMIATPVDRPVINVDFYAAAFYGRVDAFWEQHRVRKWVATNETATCAGAERGLEVDGELVEEGRMTQKASAVGVPSAQLEHVLLVTIGGGVRDLMVHGGLTASRFSDVHSMSDSIPDVWLSTDHVCSVWCLQQMLVINRFLFDIIEPTTKHTKHTRLAAARHRFAPDQMPRRQRTNVQLISEHDAAAAAGADAAALGEWHEDSRRQFSERFANGMRTQRTQMIRLHADEAHRYADVQLVNAALDERVGWLFGCAALETNRSMRYCSRAVRLDGYAERVPSQKGGERTVLRLDLHALRQAHRDWTHVLVRMGPTTEAFQLIVDIHGDERVVHVQMPKWYSFAWSATLHETAARASTLRMLIGGLHESYQSLEVQVAAGPECRAPADVWHVTATVCVPWTVGCGRHHHFIDNRSASLFVDVPVDKPHGYNTTLHPVTVNFHLDSECQLTIRVRNSFARTAANIVQQFAHWLPAHLAAVVLLALKHQLTVSPKRETFKCAALRPSILRSSSFFIITASRVFVKIIEWSKAMPSLDGYEHSMVVSVLVHGSAVALAVLLVGALNAAVRVGGSAMHRVSGAFVQCWPVLGASTGVWSILIDFPPVCGTIVLGVVMSTCGGLALVLACGLYLLILMDMQRKYLMALSAEAAPNDSKSKDKDPASTEKPDENTEENTPAESAEKPIDLTLAAGDATADNENIIAVDDATATQDAGAPPSMRAVDAALGLSDDERLQDAELNRLIRETMESRKNGPPIARADTDEAQRRAEWEAMDVRANAVHLHSALFAALVVLTLLNAPSVLAWSQNVPFSYSLGTDPSFIPAVVSILSLVIMWQINAPRQINGYSTIGSLLYMMAALCILYGQDSVYRLNAFLSATFLCLAAHQWLTPLYVPAETNDSGAEGTKRKKPLTPEEIDEMLEKIMAAEKSDMERAAGEVEDEDVDDDEEGEDGEDDGEEEVEEEVNKDRQG